MRLVEPHLGYFVLCYGRTTINETEDGNSDECYHMARMVLIVTVSINFFAPSLINFRHDYIYRYFIPVLWSTHEKEDGNSVEYHRVRIVLIVVRVSRAVVHQDSTTRYID